jgi:group I intron endonuclease
MHNQSGVYLIANIETMRVYVGSAGDITKRIAAHKAKLRAGTHGNSKLQTDWSEYGEKTFTFSILEHVSSRKQQEEREQYWMDRLILERELYNVDRFAKVHGRKPLDVEPSEVIHAKVKRSQKEKFARIGGARWLRKKIDDEPEPDGQ